MVIHPDYFVIVRGFQNGENTFIFNAEIDNGVMFAAEATEDAELKKASILPWQFPD